MARIDIEYFSKERKGKNVGEQELAIAKYLFTNLNGTEYFQINMYGTPNRIEPNPPCEHASQVIQIDKRTAVYLVNLFKEHFNI